MLQDPDLVTESGLLPPDPASYLPTAALSSEGLAAREGAHHLESVLGLVHGHHVARVVDLQEGEAVRRPRSARLLAANTPRVVGRRVEGGRAVPRQGE
eukprot:4468869-Prymnesium_polylepis.1